MEISTKITIKKIAVLYPDGGMSVNLYTGEDYLDYDRHPEVYKKYFGWLLTVNNPLGLIIDSLYPLRIAITNEHAEKNSVSWVCVDEIYRFDKGVLKPYPKKLLKSGMSLVPGKRAEGE